MPNDVKAYVSAAVAVVAIILAYWSGSPVRPEFGSFVLASNVDTTRSSRVGGPQDFLQLQFFEAPTGFALPPE
jgi:hypothetical protein